MELGLNRRIVHVEWNLGSCGTFPPSKLNGLCSMLMMRVVVRSNT